MSHRACWGGTGQDHARCAELADLDLDGAVGAVAVQTRDSLRVHVERCSLSVAWVVSGGSSTATSQRSKSSPSERPASRSASSTKPSVVTVPCW